MSTPAPDPAEPTRGTVNRRTKGFRDMFDRLPKRIQRLAAGQFQLFLRDPSHPSLRWHRVKDSDKGSHKNGSVSVSVNMQYRALYYPDDDRNIWYWIGTHAEFDTFAGLG